MNPLNNNQNQIKEMLNNPQIKSQIQQLYSLWQGDQQGFINYMIRNNPKLNNNPMLRSVLLGQLNPQQIFNEMLNQYGLTQNDFMSLLK